GDNTDNSEDSRYFGYVKKSRIKGRLFLIWMPLNRIGFIREKF
ncbi:S26 family signal peptidase, partial [uncultured Sneathia sp.]